jgi:hypothetical protein
VANASGPACQQRSLGGERDRDPCRPAADHPLVVGIVVFSSASPHAAHRHPQAASSPGPPRPVVGQVGSRPLQLGPIGVGLAGHPQHSTQVEADLCLLIGRKAGVDEGPEHACEILTPERPSNASSRLFLTSRTTDGAGSAALVTSSCCNAAGIPSSPMARAASAAYSTYRHHLLVSPASRKCRANRATGGATSPPAPFRRGGAATCARLRGSTRISPDWPCVPERHSPAAGLDSRPEPSASASPPRASSIPRGHSGPKLCALEHLTPRVVRSRGFGDHHGTA